MEAKNSIDRLHGLVSNHYQAMSSRLLALESQERQQDCAESTMNAETEVPGSDAVSVAPATPQKDTNHSAIGAGALETFDFSQELLGSRVYRRALERRNSAFSSDLCTLTWSYLSSVSLGEISNISVIDLAVTKQEIYIDPEPIDHIRGNEDIWPSGQFVSINARNRATQNVKGRVCNWHGLNPALFGYFHYSEWATPSATKESEVWMECWLFTNIVICVTRKQMTDGTDTGFTDLSEPKCKLKASILVQKHLLRAEPSCMSGYMTGLGLTLYLSVPGHSRLRLLFFSQAGAEAFTSCLRHYYPYAFPVDES